MTSIQSHILSDLQTGFGITPIEVTPVCGGYLNKKWKLRTQDNTYLLKLFSPVRYPAEKLNRIERALQRQIYLYEQGVSCPRVYARDGRILNRVGDTDDVLTYMLMSFEEGVMPTPQTVTEPQMTDLGVQCANMHHALSYLHAENDTYYPLEGQQIVRRLADHRAMLNRFPDYPLPPQTDAILSSLDASFFDAQAKQLCHEDFSADNLLFCGDRAVILDFDRGQYSFPLHDVGRALMSLAFDGKCLRMPLVRAFATGYRRHLPLTEDDLCNALRLTFACEFSWWMHPDAENTASPKVSRFVSELRFLIHLWEDIPAIIQGD